MKQRKLDHKKAEYGQVSTVRYLFFAVCLFFLAGGYVSAQPASLVSASSPVYETADESSSAVGNLVQGNTFELQESITTENGERWHRITMSNGVQGYIKGEVSTEGGDSASGPVTGDNGPDAAVTGEAGQATGEVTVPDGDSTAQPGAEGEPDAEGDAGEEDPEDPDQDAEDGEADDTTRGGLTISNNTQKKNYSIRADADRIRTQEQSGAQGTDFAEAASAQAGATQLRRTGVDKTLVLLLCVTLLSVVVLYYSYRRLKQQLFGTRRHTELKKKKKTKRTKKKRTAKEAKKWKENSLQK